MMVMNFWVGRVVIVILIPSKELIAEDLITYNLFPYMENNKLHFMGIYSNNAEIGEVNATDIEVNLD